VLEVEYAHAVGGAEKQEAVVGVVGKAVAVTVSIAVAVTISIAISVTITITISIAISISISITISITITIAATFRATRLRVGLVDRWPHGFRAARHAGD
jgi:hypothetical protein